MGCDISDLVIPAQLLNFIIAIMNQMRELEDVYTDKAYKDLKNIIISLAQITMKRQKEEDIKRFNELLKLPDGL